MKGKVKNFLLIFITLVLSLSIATAQDTVEVPVLDPNEGEFLNNYIEDNPGDVYVLKRGETYFINAPIISSEGLNLVGEEGSEEVAPAKVRAGNDAEGNLVAPTFDVTGDFTLKNVYIIGRGVNNVEMQNFIGELKGDEIEVLIDNSIIEGNDEFGFYITGKFPNVTVTNSVFRNNLSISAHFSGRCLWLAGVGNEVIMKNNTFFNNVAYQAVLQPTKKFVFDHNTIVNQMTDVFFAHNMANAKITNNIFYNPEWLGQYSGEFVWKNPDPEPAGVICQDTLTADADSIYRNHLLGEDYERTVEVKNNAYYWQQDFKDKWGTADSLVPASFIDENTMKFFNDNDNYPGMVAENNVEQDPGFTELGNNLDSMIQQIGAVRGDAENVYWGVPTSREVVWPLPEDFSYSADLTGSDGKPLGDLNWYPDVPNAVDQPNSQAGSEYVLEDNYPNPFNPTTNIGFRLKNRVNVTVTIYNMLGQKVEIMHLGKMSPAHHTVKFDGSDLSSGVYIYRIQAGTEFTESKKMVLMK